MRSVEQLAKESVSRQSTSSVGSLWKANCCRTSPLAASQMMAVLSTLPLSRYWPVEFHLREKMGPLCLVSVLASFPDALQIRACPSYEPVASWLPSWFQSRVVTSLLFSLSVEKWCNTTGSAIPPSCDLPHGPSGTCQMRAVESPEPEASWPPPPEPEVGLHAQMKTSEVCPDSVVTCSSVSVASADPPCASSTSIDEGPPPPLDPSRDLELESLEPSCRCWKGAVAEESAPSSETLFSSSVYMSPFCMKLTSWPGGILEPFTLLLATRDSAPKVKAEWRKPDSCRYL
mmetsp:Transcript_77194/g.186551  ORF Transcript_77194/g.186551 Transcript_77194/m.186551 type:complete len:288 (+) Transcript_77194:669-1532(+)